MRPAPPKIDRIEHRISTLERRQEYLEYQLSRSGFADTTSAQYDRAEHAALAAAILALRFVRDLRQSLEKAP